MQRLFFLSLLFGANFAFAQTDQKPSVERACLDYIEGFYEGDSAKLVRCLSPNLFKFGYFKDKSGAYSGDAMTFQQAIDFANSVLEKKRFAKPDAPKEVKILDIQEQIACARVVAWWGLDYILLSKKGDIWQIDQVLWQGPVKTVVR